MKFKKTKLTALAMSVLMAASTITSVTWASDLFTDSPAEAAVEVVSDGATDSIEVDTEEPIMIISNGETEGLLKAADHKGNLKSRSATKDSNSYTVSYYEGDVYENGGKYFLPVTVVDGGGVNVPTDDLEGKFVKSHDADCLYPKRDEYSFTYGNATFSAYLFRGDKLEDHKGVKQVIEGAGELPTCTKDGFEVSYTVCESCGMIKTTIKTTSGKNTYDTFANLFPDAYNAGMKVGDVITASYYKTYGTQSGHLIAFDVATVSALKHKWVKQPITVIPPVGHKDRLSADELNKYVGVGKFATAWDYYADKANCTINDQKQAGYMNADRDAYYYEVSKCEYCGEEKGERVTFYNAGMTEGTKFYRAGDNVYGFVYVNSNGFLALYDANNDGTPDSTIPEALLKDVALEDCDAYGTYYLCTVNPSGYTVTEDTLSKKGHTLKNVELCEEKSDIDNLEWRGTEYTTRPDGRAGYIVKDYDENHNVTGVYSKNCRTEAYYELMQGCFGHGCLYRNVSVEGRKKAAAGPHVWKVIDTDPVKIDYTLVDANHHMEHYYDNVKCELCDKTDLIDSQKPDALVSHKFAVAEIKDSRVEPTCSTDGSYERGETCPCGYVNEDTITTVTVPHTDKHDFGTNEAFLEWSGEVYIDGGDIVPKRSFAVNVVRKCNVCGLTDSNGINTQVVTEGSWNKLEAKVSVDPKSIVDAKKDPSTGVTYPCSTAHATVYVDWTGTVDGKVVKLNSTTVTNAVKENVPYYGSIEEYEGRTAHHKAPAVKENVTPTSYDEVIYCEVCGDEISRKTITLTPETQIQAPAVTATAVNYNTVNVSWTPVEGATSYRLYYRSADLGITTWHRVRTLKGTSFTHSGLTTGARYRYTVRAEVNGKLGDYSRTGSVSRPLPAAPEMKSVTAVSNGTKVTWSKVDGADGYIIFRKTTGAFTRVGAVSRGSKVTWTDKKPVSGATYKVRAYRTVNNVNYKGAFSAAK